jgi:5-methylthioadenosine/S-adenosylhomocysteine deaminase
MVSTFDPLDSAPLALAGRVVTMDASHRTLDGVVYCRSGDIVDVRPNGDPAPDGFEQVAVVQTGGSIYPGLIELHNHLAYDALPLWQVPQRYDNRDDWGSPNPPYRQLISGPMQVLGDQPSTAAAVARYTEIKCLLGGTTTSQGTRLFSSPAIVRFYRGLVRNVEQTGDPKLPNARARIPDVAAKDADAFLAEISGDTKMILHLAEGTNQAGRHHFLALQQSGRKWAITDNLIGIHCVALTGEDFAVLADHGGSMVWSPFSNLLLYGATAHVATAHRHGVPIALGSDWSPSGSKNLLGELKVARLVAPEAFEARDLVDMATRAPAAMLGWDDVLGSIAPDHRADLIVVHGVAADPYQHLIDADETDVELSVIDGRPRAGTPALMLELGVDGERIAFAGVTRLVDLTQSDLDPAVAGLTVAEATSTLRDALAGLGDQRPVRGAVSRGSGERLVVEGLIDTHTSNRHNLALNGQPTGPPKLSKEAAEVDRTTLHPITLDPLTAAGDHVFAATITAETNLPTKLHTKLPSALQ